MSANSIPEKAKSAKVDKLELDEKKFRWMLNDNAMAYEKTGEGIRKFAADVVKLEKFVASKLNRRTNSPLLEDKSGVRAAFYLAFRAARSES